MTDILEVLPGDATEVPPKIFNIGSTEPVDVGLEAVNKCLAAAGLHFDVAELWRFAPDTARRLTSRPPVTTPSVGLGGKPSCEHVYAQSAILKTYTGRIAGIWNSGFDGSQAPHQHVLSPSVSCVYFARGQAGVVCLCACGVTISVVLSVLMYCWLCVGGQLDMAVQSSGNLFCVGHGVDAVPEAQSCSVVVTLGPLHYFTVTARLQSHAQLQAQGTQVERC